MPGKKSSQAKSLRCSYKESGARCPKIGTVTVGQIAFCGPHARLVQQAAQRASGQASVQTVFQQGADLAGSILRDFLDGKPISRDRVASAINDFAWNLGGAYASYNPDLVDVEIGIGADGQPHTGPSGGRRRAQRPPPPEDPDAELRQAIAKARATLGFGPREIITPEILKARHRELVKRHHPDRGGSLERMQEINAAVDTISASM